MKINRKHPNYWNNETIVQELKQIIHTLCHFPTHKELQGYGGISNAIIKHGGIDKFREILGYKIIRKHKYYWNDDTIIKELKSIIEEIKHFPTERELRSSNHYDLTSAISINGGIVKFRKLLGYDLLIKPRNFWTEENTINGLKEIINKINYFPSKNELINMNKHDLISAINKHGGLEKFRKLFGYELIQKPNGYWTDETILKELKLIISKIGHFPTHSNLASINRTDLSAQITINGGYYKFSKLIGLSNSHTPLSSWTENKVIEKLNDIVSELGYLPSKTELPATLYRAIIKYGGVNRFRKLTGNKILHSLAGYWTDEKIIEELKIIIKKLNHFPTQYELLGLNRNDLVSAMYKNGGINKFRELLGYTSSMYEKHIALLASYTNRRGRKSEKLVKRIITEWSIVHHLPSPSYNVRLSKGNVIEFVCNSGKKIGIDVTNTKLHEAVYRKWIKKDYHNYLDELWVVVFSDVFTRSDYHKWNQESPSNVKVMSIHQFIEELDYSVNGNISSKISKLEKCTFHTKEEFKTKYIHKPFDNVTEV